MEKKVDRRIRKTKTQLKSGLAKLMMHKSINEISVKALVQEVDINRSTFYLHYSDIYDLLDEVESEILDEICNIIKKHPVGIEDNTFIFMEDILSVLDNNREMCRALMGDNGDAAFIFKMREIIKENTIKQLEKQFPGVKDDLQYAFSFCLSGCMGMVNEWLFQEGAEDSKHMAHLMFRMVMHALDIDKYEELLNNEKQEESGEEKYGE